MAADPGTPEITHRIAPPDFLADPALRAVLDALPGARLVGGCVRDALAGRPVADVDPSVVEVEVQCGGVAVAEGEGGGGFGGVGEAVQLGELEGAVGVSDVAEDAAGADGATGQGPVDRSVAAGRRGHGQNGENGKR